MKKNKIRILVMIMLVIGIMFILFALNNPQYIFPWGNDISYLVYILYGGLFGVMIAKYMKTK